MNPNLYRNPIIMEVLTFIVTLTRGLAALLYDYCNPIWWPLILYLFVHNSSSGMILGPESNGSMNTGI